VDVEVGQVQEERRITAGAQEADGLAQIATGERRLVGLLLQHLVVE
jgi:hypothetical protein